MKKDREPVIDELRAEYKRSDFPGGVICVESTQNACERHRVSLFSGLRSLSLP